MKRSGDGAKTVILLVDDSKLVRFTGTKVLGDEYEVRVAEDGAQAWEALLADDLIQLVLSDLQMPVLDGFALLEKIRASDEERLARLPVIMITGAENTEGPKERAMELGATDFITKPFDHAHLLARVRAHVSHQRQTRTLMEQVNIDPVTGLLNREGFEDRLSKDAAFVSRHRHSLAVMLIQLDSYKHLLDVIGRTNYDTVIRKIAGLLQQSVRKEDTVARAGLAQFLVSLPTAHVDSVNALARRIAKSVEACELKVKEQQWQLSLSIGVFSSESGCAVNAQGILHSAQQALEQSLVQEASHITVLSMNAKTDRLPLSFDQLLVAVQKNGQLPDHINTDELVGTLKPLLALLSKEQRAALLN